MSHRTFNNDPHGISDAARRALLDNRCEHKSKRHRTLGRRKRLSKAKRQRGASIGRLCEAIGTVLAIIRETRAPAPTPHNQP